MLSADLSRLNAQVKGTMPFKSGIFKLTGVEDRAANVAESLSFQVTLKDISSEQDMRASDEEAMHYHQIVEFFRSVPIENKEVEVIAVKIGCPDIKSYQELRTCLQVDPQKLDLLREECPSFYKKGCRLVEGRWYLKKGDCLESTIREFLVGKLLYKYFPDYAANTKLWNLGNDLSKSSVSVGSCEKSGRLSFTLKQMVELIDNDKVPLREDQTLLYTVRGFEMCLALAHFIFDTDLKDANIGAVINHTSKTIDIYSFDYDHSCKKTPVVLGDYRYDLFDGKKGFKEIVLDCLLKKSLNNRGIRYILDSDGVVQEGNPSERFLQQLNASYQIILNMFKDKDLKEELKAIIIKSAPLVYRNFQQEVDTVIEEIEMTLRGSLLEIQELMHPLEGSDVKRRRMS